MRFTIFLITLCYSLNPFAHTLSQDVLLKLVKEDIRAYEGRMLGVRYVDSLDLVSCEADKCLFQYSYQTDGCHYDYCYDLTCTGTLEFDLHTIETEPKKQECIDN